MLMPSEAQYDLIGEAVSLAKAGVALGNVPNGDPNADPSLITIETQALETRSMALTVNLATAGWDTGTVARFAQLMDECRADAVSEDWQAANMDSRISAVRDLFKAVDPDLASTYSDARYGVTPHLSDTYDSVKEGLGNAWDGVKEAISTFGTFGKWALYGGVVLVGLIVVSRVTSWIPRRD